MGSSKKTLELQRNNEYRFRLLVRSMLNSLPYHPVCTAFWVLNDLHLSGHEVLPILTM